MTKVSYIVTIVTIVNIIEIPVNYDIKKKLFSFANARQNYCSSIAETKILVIKYNSYRFK